MAVLYARRAGLPVYPTQLVERLDVAKASVVRLGHPARLLESVRRLCLDAKVASADSTEIVRDTRKEMEQVQQSISSSAGRGGSRFKLQQQMSQLRKAIAPLHWPGLHMLAGLCVYVYS